MNIGLFKNATPGLQDGTLVDDLNPLEDGDLISGQDAVGYPILVCVRLLSAATSRAGAFPIQLIGTTANKWQLAPDAGGNPGTWQAPGATLTLAGPITDVNQAFYLRPLVTSDEVVSVATEDTSVRLLIPDDVVTGVVGRSWSLPFNNLALSAVGRSWSLPYNNAGAETAVGRSWDLPYNVLEGATFTENFSSGSSPSTARFITTVAGTSAVAVTSGVCRSTGNNSSDDAWVLQIKNAIDTSVARTWTARVLCTSSLAGNDNAANLLCVSASASDIVPGPNTTNNGLLTIRVFVVDGSPDQVGLIYFDNAGVVQYLQATGTSYSTAASNGPSSANAAAEYRTVTLENDPNAGTPRWRVIVKAADDSTVLFTTPWVNWSATRGGTTNQKVWMGEQHNNFYAQDQDIDYVVVA